MKALIMAGGTGGHIFPAAAVAEELEKEGFEIRWLGSKRGMEGRIVPKLGYEFRSLPVTAWHGSVVRKLLAPLNLLRALWSSIWLLKSEKPSIVIGFGGYASAPGGVASILLGVPLILHEQNGVPGLTNRKLAGKADRILQAFPETFEGDVEVVGNPVRANLCDFERPTARELGTRKKLRILILGGSQGAESINRLVPMSVNEMPQKQHCEIWHQAGQNKCEDTQEQYRSCDVEATVVEFIDDMEKAYRWADVVVARSGASTVSELAAVGIYSILIPYPWHDDKQQYKNANWLKQAEASVWFEQEELTTSKLSEELSLIFNDRALLLKRSENAWHVGIRNSARRIVNVVKEILERKPV